MQALLNYPTIRVVRPTGNLNAANALEFQEELTTALRSNEKTMLLVDLEHVESLDSAGLMSLVSALKLAQNIGGRLGICSVSPALRIIFELTQLDMVFEIFENKAAFEADCLAK
ncbi:MAG: STAS domain-containing protein [Scytonematopsis contorta HA4267-MV1]|jgi:anti-anti-sigma factor|nr:STAS domain-containing protein [Scytonematopsis contorta HA4267-MV1]